MWRESTAVPDSGGSTARGDDESAAWGMPPALHLIFFFAAYVLGAGFAQLLAVLPDSGISIWPPSGLFIACLTLAPLPAWPWWIAAGLLAELFASFLWFHNPLPVALLIFTGNALEACVGAVIIRRLCGTHVRLETMREVLTLLLAAATAPAVSATIGSATLAYFGIQSFASALPLFWVGDATGALIVAPLALVILQDWQDVGSLWKDRRAEAGLIVLALVLAAGLSFGGYPPLAFIVLPALLWAAVRFEFKGAVVTLLLLAAMAAVFTALGLNPFSERGAEATDTRDHVTLQLFLAVSAISALIVAAISRQYQVALDRLREANDELERRVAERTGDLMESEARLNLALSAGRAGTWDHDFAVGRTVWSEARFRLFGLEPAPGGAATIELWNEAMLPGERDRVMAEWRRARAEKESFSADYSIRRADTGEIVHLRSAGRFDYDESGNAVRFSGVTFDITELKLHQERQQLLIAELTHRVKNTLATVQAIAMQSLRDRADEGAIGDFVARLGALARGHDLLARESWEGASLYEVVTRAIAPYADNDRVAIRAEGREIWLPWRQALATTMALHELCTNAAKYGALSNDSGHIEIGWTITETDRRFRFTWRERGGPTVAEPQTVGFGSRLIEIVLKNDLDAQVSIQYHVDGLVCTLDAPIPERSRRERPATEPPGIA